ncbi:MAG TPA: trypsin-like serine protease [Gemmata sp.]|nr:trypsin-like serine protease [Gemmata sp.]
MLRSVHSSGRAWLRFFRFPALVAAVAIVALIPPPARAIINGEVDEDNDFPNVGAILGPSASDHDKLIVAGSCTLIHPQVVLTAGHVTRNIEGALEAGMPIEALRVSFNSDAFDSRSWLAVSDVVTHPDYGPNGVNSSVVNDIGVLILSQPVRGIAPVTLAPAGLLDSLSKTGQLPKCEFTVAGYGEDRAFVAPPVAVGSDGLRRFAQAEYAALSSKWLALAQNPGSGGGGTSWGDSGGPVFWTDPESGESVQVAVTSWGAGRTQVGNGFYWRMDLKESLDFIDWVLLNLEN